MNWIDWWFCRKVDAEIYVSYITMCLIPVMLLDNFVDSEVVVKYTYTCRSCFEAVQIF